MNEDNLIFVKKKKKKRRICFVLACLYIVIEFSINVSVKNLQATDEQIERNKKPEEMNELCRLFTSIHGMSV